MYLIPKFDDRVPGVNSSSDQISRMSQGGQVPAKATATPIPTTDPGFLLSLIGGVLITIGSVAGMGLVAMGRPFFWGMGGMMGYYPYMMGGYYYGGYYGVMYGLEAVGIITGILVIVFAMLMRSSPANVKTYGVLIIVFSLISLVGMGGFFVGSIIGLVGGILALLGT